MRCVVAKEEIANHIEGSNSASLPVTGSKDTSCSMNYYVTVHVSNILVYSHKGTVLINRFNQHMLPTFDQYNKAALVLISTM